MIRMVNKSWIYIYRSDSVSNCRGRVGSVSKGLTSYERAELISVNVSAELHVILLTLFTRIQIENWWTISKRCFVVLNRKGRRSRGWTRCVFLRCDAPITSSNHYWMQHMWTQRRLPLQRSLNSVLTSGDNTPGSVCACVLIEASREVDIWRSIRAINWTVIIVIKRKLSRRTSDDGDLIMHYFGLMIPSFRFRKSGAL